MSDMAVRINDYDVNIDRNTNSSRHLIRLLDFDNIYNVWNLPFFRK